MLSNSGSPEPPPEDPPFNFGSWIEFGLQYGLTGDETRCIQDGEPYCFRCGKPASSFEAYDDPDGIYTRTEYVHIEEGTWNPATNRFACDACYIAIGMPVAPLGVGWKAP